MLKRWQQLVLMLIYVAPALALLIWGAVYLRQQVNYVLGHADVIIAHELARRFNREVRVGKATVARPGVAVLEDVRVAAGKTLASGTILRAKRITVYYSWRELIGGRGASAFSRVVVAGPRMLIVRRKNGTFNIQDLLKAPPGPPGPPFTGVVEVKNGVVTYEDYLASVAKPPAVVKLTDVSAYMDAAKQPRYAFRFEGTGAKGRVDYMQVAGIYDASVKSLAMDVNARGVSAPYLAEYLRVPGGVRFLGGALRVTIGANAEWSTGKLRLALRGTAKANGVSVSVPQVSRPFTNISGSVIFAGNSAAVDLTGALASSTLMVTGTVANFQKPRLDLLVRAPSANFGELARIVRLPPQVAELGVAGTGPVTARVTGTSAQPIVEVTAQVPRVNYRQLAGRQVSIAAAYQKGQLSVKALRLQVQGASVEVAGTVTLAPQAILALRGRIGRIPISSLPLPDYLSASGTVTGTFTVAGPATSPAISISASVSSGSLQGVRFSSASVQLRIAGGTVRVSRAVIQGVGGGVVTARGTVSPQGVDLNLTAEGVKLGVVGPALGVEDVAGVAYINGHLIGSLSSPAFSGSAEVFNGQYQDYAFDYASAAISATRQRVAVSSGVVRMYPSEIAFSGAVSGLGASRLPFRGSLHVDRMRVQRLLSLIGSDADVTGMLTGDISGSGVYRPNAGPRQPAFADVSASVDLRVEDSTAYGVPISTAVARATVAQNKLTVESVTVTSENAELGVTGTANIDSGQMNLNFALSGLELARLSSLSTRPEGLDISQTVGAAEQFLVASGVLSANGTVTGTFSDPVISASGSVANPRVNYKPFDAATFSLTYANDVLSQFVAELVRGEQVVAISGSGYNPATNCVDSATATVASVSVPDLWDMFRSSPYVTSPAGEEIRNAMESAPRVDSGVVNARLSANGCLTTLNGTLNLTATNIGMGEQEVERIALDATAVNGVVTLDQLLATSGDTRILASGSPVYQDGQVHVDFAAQNLDLARLRPWLGPNIPSGVLDAEFRVDGPVESPHVIGSLEVLNPSYAGMKFDALRASTIEVTNNRIDISGVILAADGHQASAQGYLPWSWSGLTVPEDQPLELTASLNQQSLSILGLFISAVNAENTTGTLEAQVRVAGTLSAPQLSGSAQVTGGKVAFTGTDNTLTGVNVDMGFDGSRVVVNQFLASSSLGGTVRILPGSYVTVGNVDESRVELVAENASFAVPKFTNSFTNITADLLFNGTSVVVNQLSANSSLGGSVRVVPGGTVTIGDLETSQMDLRVELQNLVLEERNLLGFQEAVVVQLMAGVSVTGSLASPLISGAAVGDAPAGVRISNSKISFLVPENLPPRGELTFAINPRFSVPLVVGDNVVVSPPNMTMVVRGDGTLAGSLAQPDFSATLTITQGSIKLAAVRLNVEPGGRIFASYAPAEVRVNLQATTTVLATNPLGERERYQVTVTVTGAATDLQISLSSSPPGLSREQMLAALGHIEGIFTTGEAGLQQELQKVLSSVGTAALFSPIESLFVERLGFEQFTLEYGLESPLALFFSRRLFGNFFMSAYQRLTSSFANVNDISYEVILSYRLKSNWRFSIGADSRNVTTIGVRYVNTFR